MRPLTLPSALYPQHNADFSYIHSHSMSMHVSQLTKFPHVSSDLHSQRIHMSMRFPALPGLQVRKQRLPGKTSIDLRNNPGFTSTQTSIHLRNNPGFASTQIQDPCPILCMPHDPIMATVGHITPQEQCPASVPLSAVDAVMPP